MMIFLGRYLRRIVVLLTSIAFVFCVSFSVDAANGFKVGGALVDDAYLTHGWLFSDGISHAHYCYNNMLNGSAVTSTSSGTNFLPSLLSSCTSWDAALSNSMFTYTNVTSNSQIRFQYVQSTYLPADAWCAFYTADGTCVSDGLGEDPTSDYSYAIINIVYGEVYSDFFEYIKDLVGEDEDISESLALRTLFTHEIGHALALKHTTPIEYGVHVIMEPNTRRTYALYRIYTPQGHDIEGVENAGY